MLMKGTGPYNPYALAPNPVSVLGGVGWEVCKKISDLHVAKWTWRGSSELFFTVSDVGTIVARVRLQIPFSSLFI